MAVSERPAKCQHCGDEWTAPLKHGFPPKFCPKSDCQAAKHKRRMAQLRLARQQRERRKRDDAERAELMREVMKSELATISERADDRRLAARNELRADIRRLAHAEGIEETYDALLDLAADALAFATRIRPPARDIEPAYDRVAKHIEDYEELMVA